MSTEEAPPPIPRAESRPAWSAHTHGLLDGREFGCGVFSEELAGNFPLKCLEKQFMGKCLIRDLALYNHPRESLWGTADYCVLEGPGEETHPRTQRGSL